MSFVGRVDHCKRRGKRDKCEFYTDDSALLDGNADRFIHLSQTDPLLAAKVQSQPGHYSRNARTGNRGK